MNRVVKNLSVGVKLLFASIFSWTGQRLEKVSIRMPQGMWIEVSKPKHFRLLLWTAAACLLAPAAGRSVNLAWDASPDPTVVGYNMYWGLSSGVYAGKFDLGNSTTCDVSGMNPGTTYFFAVTAYDNIGLESGYSGEVAYLVPSTPTTPPTIYLTSPSSGASFAAPAAINLAASVLANGHSLLKVQFLNGTSLLGEVASAPYNFAWNNVPAGVFSLSARLVYDTNSTLTSSVTSVTVTNLLPSIALVAPLSGTTLNAPSSINLAASVVANGHAITKVQFYNGASLIGEVASAPYNLTWSGVSFGPMILTARLVYDSGGIVTSAPVSLTVTGSPSPWQSSDIGAVGLAGSANYTTASGLFTVKGSGADIWGSSDAFRFVWQPVSGDCDVRARVTGLQAADGWAKTGVMIRETLNAGSAQAAMLLTLSNSSCLEYRASTSGSSGVYHGAVQAAPYWVRIVRTGSTFSGFVSPDGTTWSAVGTPLNIPMNSAVYVGLCVCSHNTSESNTSTFSSVVVSP